MYRLAVLTISDKGFKGERDDLSGKLIMEMLNQPDYDLVFHEIVPDDEKMIGEKLTIWADQFEVNLWRSTEYSYTVLPHKSRGSSFGLRSLTRSDGLLVYKVSTKFWAQVGHAK